jgi:hypothetical protein
VKVELVMVPAIDVPLLVVTLPVIVDFVQMTLPMLVVRTRLPEFVAKIFAPTGTLTPDSVRTGEAEAMAGTAANARSPTTVARIRLYMSTSFRCVIVWLRAPALCGTATRSFTQRQADHPRGREQLALDLTDGCLIPV